MTGSGSLSHVEANSLVLQYNGCIVSSHKSKTAHVELRVP